MPQILGYIGPVLLTSGAAPGSGIMSVEYGEVPKQVIWLVERVAVETDSVAATTAKVYITNALGRVLADATNSGNLDIGDQFSPIRMPPGTKIEIEWTGATAGAKGKASIQVRVEALDKAAVS